jgi:hypothetical protein
MSHHTLQKLMVRLLFDEALVAQLYSTPDEALAGLELTPAEREQLLSVDRRAWGHDPLLCRRTLRTLVEEFKISTTIILAETHSIASLEAFFSSRGFHDFVEQRGSMAQGFAEFMLDGFQRKCWNAPQLPDVVRLESAMVSCRRSLAREGRHKAAEMPTSIDDRMRVRLAPGCDVGGFQANVIATIQHVEKYLFEMSLMPAMALCDDAPRLADLPAVNAQQKTYLLFSPGASGISITSLDKSAFLLLYETRRPMEIRSLLARATTPKAAARAQEILAESLESDVLMLLE